MSLLRFSRAVIGGAVVLAGLAACQSVPKHPALDLTKLEAKLESGSPYPLTTSLVVYRDDTIVYEGYFDQGRADLSNDTRSATKTLVALAVGAAIADGALTSVDDLAFEGFPDKALSPLKAAISYRDLLTMSSALHCDDNQNTPGTEDRMHETEVWQDFVLGLPDQPDYARDEEGLGSFRYCTAGTFWLGQALEQATGQPVDAYIADRLFAPLGISEYEWFRSPSGEVQTGGGLRMTARDLGKVIRLIRDGGTFEGRRVLPTAWIEEMTTAWRYNGFDAHYGYQIWRRDLDYGCGQTQAWMMGGNGGNYMISFEKEDVAIVLTRQAYNTPTMHMESGRLIQNEVLPALLCEAG